MHDGPHGHRPAQVAGGRVLVQGQLRRIGAEHPGHLFLSTRRVGLTRPEGLDGLLVEPAGRHATVIAAQGHGHPLRQRLMLVVGEPVGAALHPLGGLIDRHRLPVVHLDQFVVEGTAGMHRVHDLLRFAPILGRALLEEPQRVPVAVLDVVEARLLPHRGVGDRHRMLWQVPAERHPTDGGRVLGLLEIHVEPAVRQVQTASRLRSLAGVQGLERGQHVVGTADEQTAHEGQDQEDLGERGELPALTGHGRTKGRGRVGRTHPIREGGAGPCVGPPGVPLRRMFGVPRPHCSRRCED